MIEASTEAAARSAGRSLDGAFSRQIHALVEDVITLRMLVEATLDFRKRRSTSWRLPMHAASSRRSVRSLRTCLAMRGRVRYCAKGCRSSLPDSRTSASRRC
ncbi:hypothetical protein [Burkholderia sp. MS455]|uniref:hypothetical protein n=1 Tax=Burkholderia sp. MS455 TaxID=2811788 RepID=UPI001EF4C4BE|nr:hypothetical protein [Burkholderia sp. MS455]